MRRTRALIETRRVSLRTLCVVMSGLLCCMTAGCMAANREREADAIRAAVLRLPGVSAGDVSYINDFENGANIDVALEMIHASTDQIADVASAVRDLEGSDFDGHRRTLTITAADGARLIRHGDIDPARIAHDIGIVRAVRAEAIGGDVRWIQGDGVSRFEAWDVDNIDDTTRTAIGLLSPGDVVDVQSAQPERQNSWEVTLPLSVFQFDTLGAVREHLPTKTYWLSIDQGHISGVSIGLGAVDPYADAVAVLNVLQPSRTSPVSVEWRIESDGTVDEFTTCAALPAHGPTGRDFASLRDYFHAQPSGCDA
jgi:hypothetical protein